jgi:ATP-dependent DNA helicase PIF1
MELTEDQQLIFDEYKKGSNIFITGPGGCGKSFIIKKIVNNAKEDNIKLSVCAMTGCASVLLDCGAVTLHSWSGIGLAKGGINSIIDKISTNKYKKKKWIDTELLIIDEVSMMSKYLFELLDSIGKNIRKSSKPFGGIQLIFSGDFYQLPPVGNKDNEDSKLFCFESLLWDDTFDYQILLDKTFRQKDPIYINILNSVREGNINNKINKVLKQQINKVNNYDIQPVVLYPTKNKVNNINNDKLLSLETREEKYTYKIKYEPVMKTTKPPTKQQLEYEEKYILSNSLFEEELILKIGCQVMCIKNIDLEKGICNGTTGIVVDFDIHNNPSVKLKNGLIYTFKRELWESENIQGLTISQIPLILAWAVTIHKSQGATLDCAEVDIGNNIFSAGQTYVALSRIKSLEGLYIKSYNPSKIKVNKKAKLFYERFYADSDEE